VCIDASGGEIRMSKVCVVVPTYNEAENLSKLVTKIERVLHALNFTLVIVDDDSPDETAKVAQKLSNVYGNIIVRCRKGESGLGSAVVEGLRAGLAMSDVERIVTLDADLSHSPSDIPIMLHAGQRADLVQGSRYVRNGSVGCWSLVRRLTSHVANVICRLLFGASIHDYTGNFRVYSRECAEAVVDCTRCRGFDWPVETISVATRRGFKVKEVPISFRERADGETKLKAKDVVDWLVFAWRSFFSFMKTSVAVTHHSNWAIHRSSTFNVTETEPITSTTTYTLSRESPGLSDHAKSTCLVKSNE
jgi:dolichol-phosphate mannosyltransferase